VSNNRTVLIWDTDIGEKPGHDTSVLWKSYEEDIANNKISIHRLVEGSAEKIKSQYLSLIYDLGEAHISGKRIIDHLAVSPKFSCWWMTLLVEKCNYSKSPLIVDIIKLIAFKSWLGNKNFTTIKLVSENTLLADSIDILSNHLGITFVWVKLLPKKSTLSLARKIYNNLPDIIKTLIYFSYYLIDHWKLKGVGVGRWKDSAATVTFTSYFFNLTPEDADQGFYRSRYWSVLPDTLRKDNVESNWLHLFVKSELVPTTSTAKKLIEKFNKSHHGIQNHVFIDSFLSLKIVRRTIIDWITVLSKYGKIKSGTKRHVGYLWPLIKSDLKASLVGVSSLQNLLYYHLFRSAMQVLPTQKKGVYLQENQGWEIGFVSSWREFGHEKLISVPHSTVRYWDLRYFSDPRSYKQYSYYDLPLPDSVAVNGEVTKNQYINGGYAADNLIEVEALRYLHIEKIGSSIGHSSVQADKNEPKVLVLGDYLQEYTNQQMKLLREAYRLINVKVKFIIKPHPMCPIYSQDYPEIDMLVTDQTIDQLIYDCVMVYTSSATSSAVDAYCAGTHVITILDPSTLNLSPLKNCKDVSFVSTPIELADIINVINQTEIEEDQGKDYFYLDADLPRWSKLLIDNGLTKKQVLEDRQN
jgi:surface carbohydrate biosynthesis protein (TIGR04326 family)